MIPHKSAAPRVDVTRLRILNAAERLLGSGTAEFSMRELASEAGVSFATPFNQFGSKAAIMRALSSQRIAAMAERFARAEPPGDVLGRVATAVDIASAVMLAEPAVNRAVIGTLGVPGTGLAGQVHPQSKALWALAIEGGTGLDPALAGLALDLLPDQLAIAFRGVLSFWTAGEFSDADLARHARTAMVTALLGFLDDAGRAAALSTLRSADDANTDPGHAGL